MLGGMVNVAAGAVFAMLVWLGRPQTVGATVRTLFRAEAAKVAVIVLQLWLVFVADSIWCGCQGCNCHLRQWAL